MPPAVARATLCAAARSRVHRRPAVGGPRQHGVARGRAAPSRSAPRAADCILPHRRSRLAALPARPARARRHPGLSRLPALASADTMRLTETLLVSSSGPPTVHADTIIRESAGSPFLVEQMVRYALDSNDAAGATGIGLGEMLESRIRALPEGARQIGRASCRE